MNDLQSATKEIKTHRKEIKTRRNEIKAPEKEFQALAEGIPNPLSIMFKDLRANPAIPTTAGANSTASS